MSLHLHASLLESNGLKETEFKVSTLTCQLAGVKRVERDRVQGLCV